MSNDRPPTRPGATPGDSRSSGATPSFGPGGGAGGGGGSDRPPTRPGAVEGDRRPSTAPSSGSGGGDRPPTRPGAVEGDRRPADTSIPIIRELWQEPYPQAKTRQEQIDLLSKITQQEQEYLRQRQLDQAAQRQFLTYPLSETTKQIGSKIYNYADFLEQVGARANYRNPAMIVGSIALPKVTRSVGTAIETVGTIPVGAEAIIRNPAIVPGALKYSIPLMAESIVQQARSDPLQLASDIVVMNALFEGAARGAGASVRGMRAIADTEIGKTAKIYGRDLASPVIPATRTIISEASEIGKAVKIFGNDLASPLPKISSIRPHEMPTYPAFYIGKYTPEELPTTITKNMPLSKTAPVIYLSTLTLKKGMEITPEMFEVPARRILFPEGYSSKIALGKELAKKTISPENALYRRLRERSIRQIRAGLSPQYKKLFPLEKTGKPLPEFPKAKITIPENAPQGTVKFQTGMNALRDKWAKEYQKLERDANTKGFFVNPQGQRTQTLTVQVTKQIQKSKLSQEQIPVINLETDLVIPKQSTSTVLNIPNISAAIAILSQKSISKQTQAQVSIQKTKLSSVSKAVQKEKAISIQIPRSIQGQAISQISPQAFVQVVSQHSVQIAGQKLKSQQITKQISYQDYLVREKLKPLKLKQFISEVSKQNYQKRKGKYIWDIKNPVPTLKSLLGV